MLGQPGHHLPVLEIRPGRHIQDQISKVLPVSEESAERDLELSSWLYGRMLKCDGHTGYDDDDDDYGHKAGYCCNDGDQVGYTVSVKW